MGVDTAAAGDEKAHIQFTSPASATSGARIVVQINGRTVGNDTINAVQGESAKGMARRVAEWIRVFGGGLGATVDPNDSTIVRITGAKSIGVFVPVGCIGKNYGLDPAPSVATARFQPGHVAGADCAGAAVSHSSLSLNEHSMSFPLLPNELVQNFVRRMADELRSRGYDVIQLDPLYLLVQSAPGGLGIWEIGWGTDDAGLGAAAPYLAFPGSTTDITWEFSPGERLRSLGNSPNPVSGSTTFAFDLAQGAEVTIRVYDVQGRLVSTVFRQTLARGRHRAEWRLEEEQRSLVPGVYFYRLNAAGESKRGRLVIVR